MATLRPTHRLHRQTLLIALLGLVAALLSAPVTAAAQPPPARLAGPDRYATAAAVVEATFDQATTVYVATGEGFADALAGGPRAALDGAPILLVQREAIPAPTATELARLQPQRIVILGGPGAVSDAVRQQLQATGAQVQRLAGASRFATAAAISRDGFSPGVGIAYLATGDTFPDALAGGAAGGLTDGPVLLLSGATIPAETAAELARLQPQTVALLGGPAAIPDTIVLELGQHTDAPVRRLAGADRVATAVAVSQDTHHDGLTVDTVFLATAGNFPDALAGAPAVAADRGALLLTGAECIPLAVRDEIARLAPDRIVVLGGVSAISDAAAALTPCEELPPTPTFTVDSQPAAGELEPIGDSGSRPIATLTSGDGDVSEFVADEVLVATDDEAALQQFLAAHGGVVLQEIPAFGTMPPTYVVRLTQSAQTRGRSQLGANLQLLDATSTGTHTLSSERALDTLVAATAALSDGLLVGLNLVSEPQDLISRQVTEFATAADPNPFNWNQFRLESTPLIGTAEAWRALQLAGVDSVPVTIGIIDGGFGATNVDYPPGVTGNTGTPNTQLCGGFPCPFHGTDVAIAAAGVLDNAMGSVGAAGPVGRLRLYTNTGGVSSMVDQIQQAMADGVDIINMSFKGEADAILGAFLSLGENATEAAANAGIQLFAAAGNDGEDVDAEDCFFPACWEEEVHWPCELDGVTCVGGLADGSFDRDPRSNFGVEWCGDPTCSVDIFAPFVVQVGANPNTPADTLRTVNGTSFASPAAAGVMAMLIAIDPPVPAGLGLRHLLLSAARPSTDDSVGRVLNALGAVTAAIHLTGNTPPFIEITAPANGTAVNYGGFGITDAFEARTADFESGDDLAVEWEAERLADGVIFDVNPSQGYVFQSPGLYTIRASVTDGSGEIRSDEVIVDADNVAPTVTITDPASDGATFVEGLATAIHGSAHDANELQGINCSGFSWLLDGSPLASGCTPTVTFTQTGPHTLTLTVTDEQGTTGSATRQIVVNDPPVTGPPSVSITSPAAGTGWDQDQEVQLSASASDPDGDAMTYQWSVTHDLGTTVIATTPTLTWTPHDHVPTTCGSPDVTLHFTATAPDGTGSDAVVISVHFGPC